MGGGWVNHLFTGWVFNIRGVLGVMEELMHLGIVGNERQELTEKGHIRLSLFSLFITPRLSNNGICAPDLLLAEGRGYHTSVAEVRLKTGEPTNRAAGSRNRT